MASKDKNWNCPQIFIGIIIYYANFHSIVYLQPTLVLMDGSDQLGYANVAAWLLTHTMYVAPVVASPHHIFESWVQYAINGDKRFGTYYFYTALLLFKNWPASYWYDYVMGVALCVGGMGVIAVTTTRVFYVFLLALAFIFSVLLGYGYGGYLGKIMGYSGILFMAMLTFPILLQDDERYPVEKLLNLFLLVIGLSTLYPGNPITFIFLGTIFFASILKTLDQWGYIVLLCSNGID